MSLRQAFWLLLIVIGLASCEGKQIGPQKKQRAVGYELFTRNDFGKSLDRNESRDLGLAAISERIQSNTELRAIWAGGISSENQELLGKALAQNPNSLLKVVIGEPFSNLDTNLTLARLPSQTFSIEKVHIAGHEQTKVQINCMLCRNLKPKGTDDGKFGILFSSTDWGQNTSTIAEAVYIYGDSNLYMRFVELYERIQQSETNLSARQTHTYSGIHDHLATFFPTTQAELSTADLLFPLEQGLSATLAPTKVRIVMPKLDASQYEFLKLLSIYQLQFQIDLKLILSSESTNSHNIDALLYELPPNTLRNYPIVLNEGGLASRFMLIDGPYALGDGTVLESRRLVFLFGSDFEASSLGQDWSAWLRIVDKDLFQGMEEHFNRIWDALEPGYSTQDSIFPAAGLQ